MPDPAPTPTVGGTPAPRSREWVAVFSIVLFPRWTGRRLQAVRPLAAWLIHVLGGLVLALTIIWLTARSEAHGAPDIADLMGAPASLGREFAREIEREVGPLPLVAICGLIGVEIAVVLLACIVVAWGAREEPIRASFRSALCRTWLASAGVWLPVLLAGGAGVELDEFRTCWYQDYADLGGRRPTLPTVPVVAIDDPNYTKLVVKFEQAMEEYHAAVAQWNAESDAFLDSQPWLITNADPLIPLLCFIAGAWFFWAWLRAVGAVREVAVAPRDPMCETCGYNLITIPLEGRCPECGEPVVHSLGPDARPGTPWDLRPRFLSRATTVRERSPSRSAARAWGRCFTSAMSAPARFGRAMRAAPVTPHYRAFLAWNLPLVFLIGFVSLPISVVLIAGIEDLEAMFIFVGSVFGLCCVVGAVLATCIGALLVGGLMGHRQGRNLLPVAVQMACYLSGYLVCWEIIGAAVSIAMIALGDAGFFRSVQAATGIWEPHLILFCWLAPNLACAVVYLVLLTRGAAAARYANK